jgi:hypothetical protein
MWDEVFYDVFTASLDQDQRLNRALLCFNKPLNDIQPVPQLKRCFKFFTKSYFKAFELSQFNLANDGLPILGLNKY